MGRPERGHETRSRSARSLEVDYGIYIYIGTSKLPFPLDHKSDLGGDANITLTLLTLLFVGTRYIPQRKKATVQ